MHAAGGHRDDRKGEGRGEAFIRSEAFFGVCGLVVVLLSIQAVERADPVTVSCQ